MKVYVITYAPHAIEIIDSVWDDKELATARLDELYAEAGWHGYWEIDEFDLNNGEG